MHTIMKKPALALGATAMLVFGASGISVAASSSKVAGTTPGAQRDHRGPDNSAALAKALGVSTTQLETAMQAAREQTTTTDRATEAAAQVKVIAKALDSDEATIQQVLDAQRPAGKGSGDRPTGTTPPERPTGTTPSGVTPPAGGRGPGGPGGHRGGHGGPGGRALADNATLVTALAKATGKSESAVKSALTAIDESRDAERKAREAEFAKNLAAELGLTQAKVSAALDAARPERPARAAKTGSGQTK